MRLPGNASVFLVCLGIAILFWFFNASSKNYSSVVFLPVKYINLPQQHVLKNSPPSEIPVEIETTGYNLIFNKIEDAIDTVVVNAGHLNEQKKEGEIVATLNMKSVLKDVARQMAGRADVVNVFTDSIVFRFDEKITKVLPVVLDINTTYAPQHMQGGEIKVLPAVVKLSGPASKMDTVIELITSPVRLKELKETKTVKVGFKLVANDSVFSTSPSQVLVSVPVEKFTEATVEVLIIPKNVPDSVDVKLFPSSIAITLNVGLSRYDDVKQEDFLAEADFQAWDEHTSNKVRVEVTKYPSFVNVVKHSPEKVEYILKKQ